MLVELEKSWNEAFYSKDLKFIESILADDFMSTYEDGSRADKKKELAATAAFDQQVVQAVQDDFTVKIFGDTAVVWFTLHLVGIKQGQRSELTLSYTDVWVLRDGNWRCVQPTARASLPSSCRTSGTRSLFPQIRMARRVLSTSPVPKFLSS